MPDITEYEAQQIKEANAADRTPVVFIHGLWLLPSSWDRWRAVFEEAGYATLAPGWPDDPSTVEDANKHPEVLPRKSVGQIADHFCDVIGRLTNKPALIGHSFRVLITPIVPGPPPARVSLPTDSAPLRTPPPPRARPTDLLQDADAHHRRHRDRQGPRPRALPGHRPRLACSRRHRPGLRPAARPARSLPATQEERVLPLVTVKLAEGAFTE